MCSGKSTNHPSTYLFIEQSAGALKGARQHVVHHQLRISCPVVAVRRTAAGRHKVRLGATGSSSACSSRRRRQVLNVQVLGVPAGTTTFSSFIIIITDGVLHQQIIVVVLSSSSPGEQLSIGAQVQLAVVAPGSTAATSSTTFFIIIIIGDGHHQTGSNTFSSSNRFAANDRLSGGGSHRRRHRPLKEAPADGEQWPVLITSSRASEHRLRRQQQHRIRVRLG